MAVRVKIKVTWESRSKTFIVLVNGGAESDEPVIVLRPEDAEELGLLSNSFDIIEVELASGKTHNLISKEKIKIELLDEKDESISNTLAFLAVDENLTEPLITDATIDELGIVVISFKKGLWRHINDPPTIIRRSCTS
ncbi:MAG: hypothetical protein ACP5GU_06905 [Thermoprotei archaeon]